jgi:hypothetical protein
LVLSVWHKGKGREAELPWTAFYDGQEIPIQIKPERPFSDRPDIYIGLMDVTEVKQ